MSTRSSNFSFKKPERSDLQINLEKFKGICLADPLPPLFAALGVQRLIAGFYF